MSKLATFQVLFESPVAVYIGGQSVIGSVVVCLTGPMKMRKLHLTFLGKASVRWTEGSGDDEKIYKAEEVYFNDRIILVGSGDSNSEVILPAGSYQYPFTYLLPAILPSSYEGVSGTVRYTAKAVIDKPWKFDHEFRAAFTVINNLDLNLEPFYLREPHEAEITKDVSCCCCVSGNVIAKFSINKRCFVPGETAVISHSLVENRSDSTINETWISFQQKVEFKGKRSQSSASFNSRVVSKLIAKVSNKTPIQPGQSRAWNNITIPIPPVVPSRLDGCSIINISYVIELHSTFGVKIPIEIVIGTVPLFGYNNFSVITAQPQPQPVPPFAPTQADQFMANSTSVPPPSYEECFSGQVSIAENGDSNYVRGDVNWAPKYPMYRQLSYPHGQQ